MTPYVRMLVLLSRDENLCKVVRNMLKGQACADSDSFYRLNTAGLIKGDSREDAELRCDIYVTYFRKHLL